MIARLRIKGIGPHDAMEFAFDATGITEIEGASKSGKTHLIDAIAFCLWGLDRYGKALPVDAMANDVAEVEIVTARGSTLRRTIRRSSRTTSRTLTPPGGEERTFATEDAWRSALAKAGDNVPALLAILVPQLWVDLAHGPGGGRPLRDLLASMVPTVGLRAVIDASMVDRNFALRADDPVDPKAAEALRADANRRRDTRAGAAEADGRRVESLINTPAPSSALAPADVERFRLTLADAKAWRDHDAAAARHATVVEQRDQANSRRRDWQRRRDEIGDRPEGPASGASIEATRALTAATKVVTDLVREQGTALATVGTAEHLVGEAERADDPDVVAQQRKVDGYKAQLVELEAAGDVCPTCKRAEWTAAKQAIEVARATVTSAEAFLEQLKSTVDKRREERVKPLRAKVETAKAKHAAFEAKIAAAREAEETARTASLGIAKEREKVRAWEQSLAAVGDAPAEPAALPAEPTAPKSERLDAASIQRCEKALAEHERAAGAVAERERSIVDAKAKLKTAETELAAAKAEATRCTALVECVRAAPSVIARTILDKLGDIGAVRLELLEDGAVNLLVGGRSWARASEGERIVADAAFRSGLRRALGVASVPLVVDSVQSVGGMDLVVTSPAILLRTTEGALAVKPVPLKVAS